MHGFVFHVIQRNSNCLLLMADLDKILKKFVCFKKKFIACALNTPEGEEGEEHRFVSLKLNFILSLGKFCRTCNYNHVVFL